MFNLEPRVLAMVLSWSKDGLVETWSWSQGFGGERLKKLHRHSKERQER
jgi:hypothetical protein